MVEQDIKAISGSPPAEQINEWEFRKFWPVWKPQGGDLQNMTIYKKNNMTTLRDGTMNLMSEISIQYSTLTNKCSINSSTDGLFVCWYTPAGTVKKAVLSPKRLDIDMR